MRNVYNVESFNDIKTQIKKETKTHMKENMPLFKKREKLYNKKKGIRVGDWIKEKNGNFTRVTYVWNDGKTIHRVQTGGSKFGQYYLGDGHIDYSGSLDEGYNTNETKFKKMSYKRDGGVWFFRNDFRTADNAVNYVMKFRVFEVV